MSALHPQPPYVPEVVKTVLVTRGPNAKGVTLDIIAAHPDEVKSRHPSFNSSTFEPKREAAEVLDALLDLPLETRREFAKLYSEIADLFVNADEKRPPPTVHPSSPRVSRRAMR